MSEMKAVKSKLSLYEKYRPQKLEQIVGQDRVVKNLVMLSKKGYGGRAFWISGISGSGKTSIARIIASEIADQFMITEFDSASTLCVEYFEEVAKTMNLYGWGKGGRAYIINEAHGLKKRVIQQMLGVLERIPGHVVFIFTTTKSGQENLFEEQMDAGPLLSRCIEISLTSKGLNQVFAKRSKEIAEKEHLDGKPIQEYVKLAETCKSNFRAMLQKIEAGTMLGNGG